MDSECSNGCVLVVEGFETVWGAYALYCLETRRSTRTIFVTYRTHILFRDMHYAAGEHIPSKRT